jgi:hypothetical protein
MRIVFRSKYVADEVTLGCLLQQPSGFRGDSTKESKNSPSRLLFSLIAQPIKIKFTVIHSPVSSLKDKSIEFSPSDVVEKVILDMSQEFFQSSSMNLKVIIVPPLVDGKRIGKPIVFHNMPMDMCLGQIPDLREENEVAFIVGIRGG